MARVHRALTALLLTTAFAAALAAPANALPRRSILERYQTYQEFEQRQFGFVQNGYMTIDLETCREPGGSALWWVAVYDHQPTPQVPAGFLHIVQIGGWNAFMTETNRLAGEGWFLDDMDAASDGSSWTNHVAIFNEWPGSSQQVIRETSFAAFHANWLAHQGGGSRLVDLDVSNVGGQTYFHGVMRPGQQQERLIHENSWASFEAVRLAMEGGGWRVRDIAVQQGEYIAVLNQGAGATIVQTFSDWPALSSRWSAIDGNRRVNTRLKDVECWVEGGQLRYAGLWRGSSRVRRPEGGVPPGTVADPSVSRSPPAAPTQPPAAERDPG